MANGGLAVHPDSSMSAAMVSSRRSFLKASASSGVALRSGLLAFCGCSLLNSAHAQQSHKHPKLGSKRPQVVIDGQRAKAIDVHAHCYFQDAVDLMGAEAKAVMPPVKGVPEHFIPTSDKAAIAGRLAAMDAMGIDMQVLSINPYWYRKDRDTAAEIVRLNNEHLAQVSAAYPKRLAAFATLSLQHPDLAVQQLEHAIKKQGLRGAAIGGSVLGEDFSETRFHPVWAKAEELGATLFIHPQSTPELVKRFKGNGWLSNTIGNPLDTTIALQHLIFEGTLDKFPGLKILAAHGGGYLGSYAPRSDHACFVSPGNCNPGIVLKKKPTEYLNQISFDALVFTPEALRHLVAQVGASQVVIGTDHPIPWEENPVDHVMATTTLSGAQRAAILGSNAAKLLNIQDYGE
jgi:predicted TIM-barrel fold metal-dependent hydrolase